MSLLTSKGWETAILPCTVSRGELRIFLSNTNDTTATGSSMGKEWWYWELNSGPLACKSGWSHVKSKRSLLFLLWIINVVYDYFL
jgi:hypothetical protein